MLNENPEASVTRAEFSFLQYTCGFWDFPKKRDQKVIDAKFVFCGPCVPMVTRRKGYQFEKDQIAINIFKDWKYGNDPMNPFVFHFTLHFV